MAGGGTISRGCFTPDYCNSETLYSVKMKLLLTLLFLLLVLVNQTGPLDDISRDYTKEGFKRALVTFAVARGLNGIISVAQGTEVAIEPAGIGLVFTPGQILDPVNDLIERFSWVVLASGTSLGIQQILLKIGAWVWFRLAVSLIVLAASMTIWSGRTRAHVIRSVLMRLALIVIVLRFSVPLLAYGNEILYRYFLEPEYQTSSESLRRTSLTLSDLNADTRPAMETPDGEGMSVLESARRIYQSTADRIKINARIQAFKQAAENISEHTINLIVIFILQTLLIPLIYLWFVLQLLKYIFTAPLPQHVNQE